MGESIDKVVKSNDTISRQQAIETLMAEANAEGAYGYLDAKSIEDCLTSLPPAKAPYCEISIPRLCVECEKGLGRELDENN